MYADDASFTATYLDHYWKEMVDELRTYAMDTAGRQLLITSNGILPYVDFNSVGMYTFNPDDGTPQGVDYVPVTNGHLNGAKSLQANYRYLKERSREVAGDAPVVIFIDWPNELMTRYLNLSLSEKMDFWQIFGAEAYANAIYPAFHMKNTVGDPTAEQQGILGFFQSYSQFYKDHRALYQNNDYVPEAVRVAGANNISSSLLAHPGSSSRTLHLVNHNYNQGILPQAGFEVETDLAAAPGRVTMVSPDFAGEKTPDHRFENGTLTVNVDGIRYYNIIVIE